MKLDPSVAFFSSGQRKRGPLSLYLVLIILMYFCEIHTVFPLSLAAVRPRVRLFSRHDLTSAKQRALPLAWSWCINPAKYGMLFHPHYSCLFHSLCLGLKKSCPAELLLSQCSTAPAVLNTCIAEDSALLSLEILDISDIQMASLPNHGVFSPTMPSSLHCAVNCKLAGGVCCLLAQVIHRH